MPHDIGAIVEGSKGLVSANVSHQETGEKIEVRYDFGADLDEAINRYGAAVVFSNFLIGAKTALRNKLYSLTHDPKKPENVLSAEAAVAALQNWVPTEASTRSAIDPLEKLAAQFADASEEEKLAKLEQVKALLGL